MCLTEYPDEREVSRAHSGDTVMRNNTEPNMRTSAQRRDEIAEILACAILRLHRRIAFENPRITFKNFSQTSPPSPKRLDSSAEMPLSVSDGHHNG